MRNPSSEELQPPKIAPVHTSLSTCTSKLALLPREHHITCTHHSRHVPERVIKRKETVTLSAPVRFSPISRASLLICQNHGICSELKTLALAAVYLMTLGNNRKSRWFEPSFICKLFLGMDLETFFLLLFQFSLFTFIDGKGNRGLQESGLDYILPLYLAWQLWEAPSISELCPL